jgi:hypothetical protein
MFGLWLIGPLLYLLLVATFGLRMTSVSYLLSFGQLSVLAMATALTESALRPAVRAGVTFGVLAILAAASWDKGVTAQRTEDWPGAARCLRERLKPGDALVFSNGISKQMLARHEPIALRGFANPGEFVYARHPRQGIAREEMVRYVGGRTRVWVLSAYTQNGPAIAAGLAAKGWTPSTEFVCGPVVFQPLERIMPHPAASRPGW